MATLAAPNFALAASTISYTYDVFGQLTAVSSTAGRSVAYTYDAAGNRTNMAATGTTALNTSPTGPTTSMALTSNGKTVSRAQAANATATQGGRAR